MIRRNLSSTLSILASMHERVHARIAGTRGNSIDDSVAVLKRKAVPRQDVTLKAPQRLAENRARTGNDCSGPARQVPSMRASRYQKDKFSTGSTPSRCVDRGMQGWISFRGGRRLSKASRAHPRMGATSPRSSSVHSLAFAFTQSRDAIICGRSYTGGRNHKR